MELVSLMELLDLVHTFGHLVQDIQEDLELVALVKTVIMTLLHYLLLK